MFPKIKSLTQLYELLPEEERIITDVLRGIITDNLPPAVKKKYLTMCLSFYGRKGICIIWPSAVPRGGIKEGVLLGFWYGNKLKDEDGYLMHGTNKQIFYKIYYKAEDIDEAAIVKLLKEAAALDGCR